MAIKRLLPHLADEENFVQSFIDEARLAATLRHQNIVQIYDCGTTEGFYYIEMEYLVGKDLTQVLNAATRHAQPLSLAYALFIVAQICLALDYAHKQKDAQGKPLNIIHRDVSPQNIVITYEGNVKMVDFGIAKAATQSTKTQVGMIKGKIAYMSPEQAEGQAIDHRSDIFSLGIILYELVTARRMFPDEDTFKLLTLVRRAEFEPPEQVKQDLPPPLYAILHKSLAKDPEQRYWCADDMLTDLEACMHHLPTWPTARGLSQYMHHLFAEEIEAPPLPTSLPPRVRDAQEPPAQSKRPWLWYAAVAEAVLMLGLVALLFLRSTLPIEPDIANLQAQLKQARWEVETGQQRRVQLEAQGGQLQDKLQQHEREARQRQQALTTAQREAQAARTESQQWQTRSQEAAQQLQQVQADLDRVKTEATATRTRLEAEAAQRTAEVTQTRVQYEQLQQQLETEQAGHRQGEARVSQLQKDLLQLQQEAEQRQQVLSAIQQEAHLVRTESQQWQTRSQEAAQQLQQVQADLDRVTTEATATRTRLEAEVAQRTTERNQAQARYEQLRQQSEVGKQGQEQSEEPHLPETVQRQQQAQASAKRGMEALAAGRCEEAAAHFQTALGLDSSGEETFKKSLARALQCQASRLMDTKQLEKAEVLLWESVKLDATSAEGYHQLGHLYYAQENYVKAAANYLEAAGLDPTRYNSLFNLGLSYMKLNKNDKAETVFDTVVKLNPPNIDEATYMLARAQNNQGQYEKCRTNLQWVHKHYPQYAFAKKYQCGAPYKDRDTNTKKKTP
jgi:serine/threonine protein kinase/Tfp pilus assembly protein PilF